MKYIIVAHDLNGGFTCKCESLKEATEYALNYEKTGVTVLSISVIE